MQHAISTFAVHADPIIIEQSNGFGRWRQYERVGDEAEVLVRHEFSIATRRRGAAAFDANRALVVRVIFVHFDGVAQRLVVEIRKW